MTEQTLSIIKPNAVANNVIGEIYHRFELAGFKIIATKMLQLSRQQAEGFYTEHQGKPFFTGLIDFMTSGPIIVQVLAGEAVIKRYRDVMGATDPAKALAGTLRADFAQSVQANAVHGSDSVESAEREIAYFFTKNEIHNR